jgi:aryl-alcohol dehydrogenase
VAARITGATTIIAVDVSTLRLIMAKEVGATHVVNASEDNPVAAQLLTLNCRDRER